MIPRILIVNDNSDARSNGLARSLRRRGAIVATAPLAAVAFDTGRAARAGDSGLRHAAAGRGARPLHRRRIVRGDHAAARRAACAGQACRAGVELRAGDRALRRQVDDDVPAASRPACRRRRPSPSRAARRREEIAARELATDAAGAEAAVRRAGTRHQADPRARRPAGGGGGERRLLSPALCAARRVRRSAISASSSAPARRWR